MKKPAPIHFPPCTNAGPVVFTHAATPFIMPIKKPTKVAQAITPQFPAGALRITYK